MDGDRSNLNHGILTREVTDDDIDVPMLSMEPPTQYVGMYISWKSRSQGLPLMLSILHKI